MEQRRSRLTRIVAKHVPTMELGKNPHALEDLLDDIDEVIESEASGPVSDRGPFGVSWMDSWVAHWVYAEKQRSAEATNSEVAALLRSLVDLKIEQRMQDIRGLLARLRRDDVPPDAGPPEPGVPPPAPPPNGPEAFLGVGRLVPPDAGPPEPGAPPAGPATILGGGRLVPPDAGPPEPGAPPPAGPAAGFLGENPWILYWFLSIKMPMLLDVIDLHLTRRLEDLATRTPRT